VRSFKVWKNQVLVWLMSLESKGKRDTFDFDSQRDYLINKLENLRSRWLSSFLADLHRFCRFWQIVIPKELLPTQEEIVNWHERK